MHMTTSKKNLPTEFLKEMKDLLGPSYNDFLKSYEEKKTSAIRVNTLKMSREKFEELGLFSIDTSSDRLAWSDESYYVDEAASPGQNPLHDAGAYYIQEPSAISVVGKSHIGPGEYILDMCAAPGGKSTYILSKLGGSGLLVSNEINKKRLASLGDNLERFGARNALITNEDSNSLLTFFKGFFDKIYVDAPCSGQGMFRKDDYAIEDWSLAKVEECSNIQKDLIRDAYAMLKPGGSLIYSTCTFTQKENEDIVNDFLDEYKMARLDSMERIWPHIDRGEGHFCARIRKPDLTLDEEDIREISPKGFQEVTSIPKSKTKKSSKSKKVLANKKISEDLKKFLADYLRGDLFGDFESLGGSILENKDKVYLLAMDQDRIRGLRVLRNGIFLGELKKNRFEPSHSLAMALKKEDVNNYLDLGYDSEEISKYLQGQPIETGQSRGWVLVCVEGCSIGWGKESGGILKNKYPKGLRRNIKK